MNSGAVERTNSADHIENDSSNGRALIGQPNPSYTNQPFALATPTTPSMIFSDPNEVHTSGNRSISGDLMEESDQDMSDGGAPLSLGIEESNSEMETVDDEIMGLENMVGLHYDSHSQPATNPFYTYGFSDGPHPPLEPGAISHLPEIHTPMLESINTTDLPAVMSEVSQQLQDIQDGQEHGGFELAPDEHHDLFINHNESTTPFDSLNFPDNFLTQPSISQGISFGPASTVAELEMWTTTTPIEAESIEWAISPARRSPNQPRARAPLQSATTSHCVASNLEPLRRCDLQGEECDIQRINWKDLGVTRLQARQRRQITYKNYTNLIYPNRPQLHPRQLHGIRLPNEDNYFRFRRMDFQHEVLIRHFQLRNLITCPSQSCVIYAGRTQIMHYNPTIGSAPSVLMPLGNSRLQSFHSGQNEYRISTLTSGHDIVVAGAFEGQYALINTRAQKGTKCIEGTITEHPNDITNHAQVHLSRSSSPLVTFASNDSGIRTLDVTTNKFISEHMYDYAMNCTAVSPDRRLRVLVGDTRKVMICNSDTGELLQELDGHLDYGFACDWSDDGWTVATGNQDMQVKIWDARYWNRPVTSIAADMAGVRKLRFSPLGSGRPILVAAEPADYVNIINAETFDSKQTLSFFGEIGGFDFTNDGQELMVANCDSSRGGIFEFERCDFATEGLCGKDEQIRYMLAGKKRDYRLSSMGEDLMEESPDLRGTTKRRERRTALLTDLGLF
ncbi:hypothetical protein EYC80_006189 [Monilinia laxa]|uniref:DUF2415 domain-containing protein n=1 Tax=Monilinia laxa TaxID=61186 RepID=A0A5N6KGE7_MONLA|nr:hypothetical protein EYC80_006189 [Monilinia laxa]